MATTEAPALRFSTAAGRWVVAITVLGSGIAALDATVVNIALPTIGRQFHTGVGALQWVMSGYTLTLAAFLLIGGSLGDHFGRRRVYTIGIVWFAIASAACGFAPNAVFLIIMRLLQGIGAALLTPGSLAIIEASFTPADRSRAIGAWSGFGGVTTAAGPLIGGYLISAASWRWIFFINVPLALAALVLAAALFPASRKPIRTPFDFPGFMLVGAGMVLLVLGMDSLAAKDMAAGLIAGQVLLAVALLGLAIFYLLRARNPVLDLRLLRIRTFRISFLTGGGLDTIGLSSVVFLLPLMFQLGFGMSAVQAGSLTFIAAVGSLLTRFVMPAVLKRFGFRRVLVFNTPIVAALVAGFALIQVTTPVWIVLAYIFIFGVFRSAQWASTGNLSYADIEPEQLARFSALYYILWQLAVAISVGAAAALLSLLAGSEGHASVNDFRVLFVIEGLVTLCALLAYRHLTPKDGAHVSGHGSVSNE